MIGRIPVYDSGSAIGTTSDGKLPNITATFWAKVSNAEATGAMYVIQTASAQGWNGGHSRAQYGFNASRSSTVYTDGQTTVVPANVNCFWCIKY